MAQFSRFLNEVRAEALHMYLPYVTLAFLKTASQNLKIMIPWRSFAGIRVRVTISP
jgi:hypothetical protein